EGSAGYAAPVVLQPGELVVNGGAEQAASVGWTGALGRATHGSGGYPASVIVDSSGATGGTFAGGNALFTGGNSSATTATQTISLAPRPQRSTMAMWMHCSPHTSAATRLSGTTRR